MLELEWIYISKRGHRKYMLMIYYVDRESLSKKTL